jgi:phospholipid/cholesterol/gamma-HCH transport system substrate-binding protein
MNKMSIDQKARLLFVIALLVIAVGAAIWYFFSAGQYTTYQILTRDSVSGLIRDAPVEFHGVQVGTVKSVELLDPHSVNILLSIKNGTPVTAATVATIIYRGLSPKGFTGYVYVSLEDTGTDSGKLVTPPGSKYPMIPAVAARDITLDARISQANDLAHSLLDKATVASLKQAVESIEKISTLLGENNETLKSLITNSERASAKLTPLLESSSNTIKALQTQILPEAYKALSNLDALSTSLRGVTNEIGRDPSILLRGTTPGAPAPGEGQ